VALHVPKVGVVMPIPQTFDSENIAQVFADLKRDIVESDLSEAFREVAPIVRTGYGENIDRAADESGSPWPAHSPTTIKMYGPHPLLVLEYHLLTALTEQGSNGNITDVQSREMTTGVDGNAIPYATTHQYGWGHIPKREYLYATNETLETASATFADWSFEIIVGSS
jgi:hypothetical protein